MRILFLLSSFETTRDGVADYTYIIANECVAKGNHVAILAWNDTFIQDGLAQPAKENGLLSLRLSYALQDSERKRIGKEFIAQFKPDVVSIQMVCFGFHSRGWIFGLGKTLRSVLPEHVSVQIMFHELWLGLATNHPFKEKIVGCVQRLALKQFWQAINPDIVHVANNVYYSLLKKLALPVYYLPLPSNISIETKPDFDWIYEELAIEQAKRETVMVFLFFGSIHSGWDANAFFQKLKELSGNKKMVVLSAGSQGNGAILWDEIRVDWAEQIQFVKFGFRADKQISELLQFSDLGICTTPMSLFGKSGTAMAMVEHGLPIVVTRNELRFNFRVEQVEDKYPNVYMWDDSFSMKDFQKNQFIVNRTEKIASRFVNNLKLILNLDHQTNE